MNPILGWALAVLGTALAWFQYGWQGVVLAVSVIVFWLLLQFSRAIRVMKNAAGAPVGHVPSAVMFNAHLKAGMTMLQLVTLSKSLGERIGDEGADPEQWRWADEGGVSVTVQLQRGKLVQWDLQRPAE